MIACYAIQNLFQAVGRNEKSIVKREIVKGCKKCKAKSASEICLLAQQTKLYNWLVRDVLSELAMA